VRVWTDLSVKFSDQAGQPQTVWRIGWVKVLYLGHNQTVRVVTINTQDGEVKRPVVVKVA